VAAPAARPHLRRNPPGGQIRPRRRFGQHFLHDAGVLARIADAVAPRPQDAIVEIGPGEGALTRVLLERVPHLDAIEIDRDLVARLAAEFPAERLTLHCSDVLAFDFGTLPGSVRLVGNLPYNISTPLLFRVARFTARMRDAHFMLQREVVDRMVAQPSTAAYGRLSVMLQVRFRLQRLFVVPRGAFRPPPRVDSAVVKLVPLEEPLACDANVFADVVRGAFSARRKMLRNALPLAPRDYDALGLDPAMRPENLSPADYVRIAALLGLRAA
jgi:16S rRNA (adenine1518-N6/adenine1519-N6)-dimethyltransferase